MRTNEKGFTAIEGMLIFIIVGIISGVGWYVWHSNKNTNDITKDADNSSTATTQDSKKTANTQYLAIEEWGIRMPLSGSISDAYYVVSTDSETNGQPNTVWLGLKSLDDKGCAAAQANSGGSYPIGAIVKALPDDTDPVTDVPVKQRDPDGVTIDGYYYGYHNGMQDTSAGCVAKADIPNAEAIDAAFRAAAKEILEE